MVKFDVKKLNAWFGGYQALYDTDIDVLSNEILTIIGPANSGKTTFLRSLNRMNELNISYKMTGEVLLDGLNTKKISAMDLRRKVGMVFALPAPLPMSIYDNVVYGVRMFQRKNRKETEAIVEEALREAVLWDEVKDRLDESGFKLSGGQQQRLCIARTLAVKPDVILFDEPCSGLDPISTAKVEDAMVKLKKQYTIVLVTNNVKQAARVGDRTAFFLSGKLIEIDRTHKIFTAPEKHETDDYIRGKFG